MVVIVHDPLQSGQIGTAKLLRFESVRSHCRIRFTSDSRPTYLVKLLVRQLDLFPLTFVVPLSPVQPIGILFLRFRLGLCGFALALCVSLCIRILSCSLLSS